MPRPAAEPLRTRNTALEVLIARAMDKSRPEIALADDQVGGVALQNQRVNGAVKSEQGPGQFVLWEVAR